MPQTSAFGGFVQGLQGGMDLRQNLNRKRRVNRAIDFELEKQEAERAGRAQDFENVRGREYPIDLPDPYTSLLGQGWDWLKGRFAPTETAATPDDPREVEPTNRAAISFADGGKVEKESSWLDRLFPETSRTYREVGADKRMRSAALEEEGISDPERGARARDWLGEGIVGTGRLYGAAARDLLSHAEGHPGVRGLRMLGGALGLGTDNAVAGTPSAAPPAAAPPTAPGSTSADSTPPAASAGPAAAALPGVGSAPAAQPDANQDAYTPPPAVDPGQMPRMKVRDWEQYRERAVEAAILRGATPAQAHQQVDQIQQRGFMRSAQQGLLALQVGDPRTASAALTAAFQYFPNGSDVRFGMTQDKAGQPALVAMGVDEESGESKGPPMLINSERLAVMMENMSNPSAFRTWTKDWRKEKFQREIFEDYTKPIGKANAETARMNARTAQQAAQTRAAGGGRGGLKQSDIDRGLAAIENILGASGTMQDIPEQDMNYLGEVAALLYAAQPGNSTATIRRLLSIYDEGGTEAVDAAVRGSE